MSELSEIERADPFQPHDPGCRCWPHVSQRAAVEAATQAATTEYREGVRVPMTPIPADDPLREALELALAHRFAGNDDFTEAADYVLRSLEEARFALQQPAHPEHCIGCAGWYSPRYLERKPCPGAALRADSHVGEGLDELRALSEKATPGPWFRQGSLINGPDKGGLDIGPLLMDVYEPRDAEFIVAAVKYVRAALSREQGRSPEGEE